MNFIGGWLKRRKEQADFRRNVDAADRTGFGHCRHCGRGWDIVRGHRVFYKPRSGMFPVCVECWPKLSREQRIAYCRLLAVDWSVEARTHHLPTEDVEAVVAGATAAIDEEQVYEALDAARSPEGRG